MIYDFAKILLVQVVYLEGIITATMKNTTLQLIFIFILQSYFPFLKSPMIR